MKISAIVCALLLSLNVCSGQEYALVSVSVTDMKERPDYESATVSQSVLGTPVEVDTVKGYWHHITTPEGYHGWVTDMNIAPKTKKEMKQWRQAVRVIVTDYFAVSYENEDFGSQVIGDAVMGAILETEKTEFARNSIFIRVIYPDGREGYMERRKIEPLDDWISTREATQQSITATAKKFLGFPYLWGGLSPKGLDCSGLVKISYFMNGLILFRDASQQVKTGKSVAPADLQPADLLFFGTKTPENPNPRISHVGIYLADGRFIHSSLVVRINSLSSEEEDFYTSKSLISATRILGSEETEGIVSIKNHPWYFEGGRRK